MKRRCRSERRMDHTVSNRRELNSFTQLILDSLEESFLAVLVTSWADAISRDFVSAPGMLKDSRKTRGSTDGPRLIAQRCTLIST